MRVQSGESEADAFLGRVAFMIWGVLSSPRDWGTPRESPRDWGHLQEVEGARVMAAAGSVSLLVEMSVNIRCLTLLEPSEANGWSSL